MASFKAVTAEGRMVEFVEASPGEWKKHRTDKHIGGKVLIGVALTVGVLLGGGLGVAIGIAGTAIGVALQKDDRKNAEMEANKLAASISVADAREKIAQDLYDVIKHEGASLDDIRTALKRGTEAAEQIQRDFAGENPDPQRARVLQNGFALNHVKSVAKEIMGKLGHEKGEEFGDTIYKAAASAVDVAMKTKPRSVSFGGNKPLPVNKL